VTISERISTSWERDGLPGILQRSALYLLRRVGWRADAWSRQLDQRLTEHAILRQYGSLLKRNEKFRNLHKGERCFVIGNGPSLKQQDLAPLANEITFVANYFHLHPIISESWQPKYYCLSDPAYFDGREPTEAIRDIVAKVPSATFFVPHYASDFLETTRALPEDRTYYVGLCGGLEDEFDELPDFTTVTPGVQTVVQLSIMAAMFMGCTRIYLMGLDHDWLTQCGVTVNFYSKDQVKNQPPASEWNYKSLMMAMTTIWRVYEMHRRIATKHGIKIINVTQGGFLDVFERARYEDIISS
jgi:6-hydroxymethylpterin diphosphokinase MptE-like protein